MPTGVTFADTRGGAPAGRPPASGGGLDSLLRSHRGEALAGAGALVVVIVALARKSAAPKATPAAATAPAATSAGTAYGTATPPAAYYDTSSSYNALEQQIGNLQSQIAGMGAQAPTAAVSSTPPPSSGPATVAAGYGVVPTAQGPMIWLGTSTPKAGGGFGFSGYNVGGGAPVYYGNAASLESGVAAAGDVYTPVAFAPFVAGSPV